MTALEQHAIRWAYRRQHSTMHRCAAAVQSLLRKVLLHYRPGFSRAEATALHQRYLELLDRDLSNAERGLYPRALLFQLPLMTYARALPQLALDIPRVVARMRRRDYRDLPGELDLSAYPAYYRRTFHWQTDGYLSRRSAALYDLGVEFLFGGTGDVMRRQVIVPLRRHFGDAPIRVLDVGCGTGRTLAQIRRALPRARLCGLDLSPFYRDAARDLLGTGVELLSANAEDMPLPNRSVDAVVSVFMFHELPANARRRVVSEIRRILKPGGLLVVLDSVQASDAEDIIYFMQRFTRELHEPFYADYVKDDLAVLFRAAGFDVTVPGEPTFLSKLVVARA